MYPLINLQRYTVYGSRTSLLQTQHAIAIHTSLLQTQTVIAIHMLSATLHYYRHNTSLPSTCCQPHLIATDTPSTCGPPHFITTYPTRHYQPHVVRHTSLLQTQHVIATHMFSATLHYYRHITSLPSTCETILNRRRLSHVFISCVKTNECLQE